MIVAACTHYDTTRPDYEAIAYAWIDAVNDPIVLFSEVEYNHPALKRIALHIIDKTGKKVKKENFPKYLISNELFKSKKRLFGLRS